MRLPNLRALCRLSPVVYYAPFVASPISRVLMGVWERMRSGVGRGVFFFFSPTLCVWRTLLAGETRGEGHLGASGRVGVGMVVAALLHLGGKASGG